MQSMKKRRTGLYHLTCGTTSTTSNALTSPLRIFAKFVEVSDVNNVIESALVELQRFFISAYARRTKTLTMV